MGGDGVMVKRMGRRARGQSTLEYILVIAAVLIALVAAIQGVFRVGLNRMMSESSNTVETAAGKVQTGLGLQ